MNRRRWWPIALLLVLALLGGACGGGKSKAKSTTTTAATAPTFPAGSTMEKIQQKGKLVVGTKFDQPGFGQKNPTNGKVEGFDVEIAKLMAVGIFGGTAASVESKIEFVETVSAVRESSITDGRVDMVVATYTINAARKQVVDFAGPYFVAKQDIMVKADDNAIKTVNDLNGKKVCSVQGSTSIKNVAAKAPRADLSIQFKTYSECAQALEDGRVQAVTTDDTILAGLVQKSGGKFKLVGAPFSDEPYGIGIKKCDDDFRDFLNNRIEDIEQSGEWAKAFDATLGKLGLKVPQPPKPDRYPTNPSCLTGSSTSSSSSTSVSGSGTSTTARASTTSTSRPSTTTSTSAPATTTSAP
jgi:glutamate transport system substrate-binding protein